MKMDINRIGSRHRDSSNAFAAESEALDQIAKEAEARLAARRQARYEARNIRLRELEKNKKEDAGTGGALAENGHENNGTSLGSTGSGTSGSNSSSLTLTTTSSVHSTPLGTSAITNGVRLRDEAGSTARRVLNKSSRRSSTDSSEDGFNLSVRDLKHELREVEEKFRRAMVANASLDNEKAQMTYAIDDLKDQLEEKEEQSALVTKELREKTRDLELLKRSYSESQRAVQLLQAQLDEQARLLAERGMVLVGQEEEEEDETTEGSTTCHQSYKEGPAIPSAEQEKRTRAIVSAETAAILSELGTGPLDVRIKKLAEDRDDLQDVVRRLKLDLEEERNRNSKLASSSANSSEEQNDWETKKIMDDYKFKMQKADQDISTLQTTVARLETQVVRYKTAAETSEQSEENLKTERRKLQRELREAVTRMEELENTNKHLETRLGKLKTAKSNLLKDL